MIVSVADRKNTEKVLDKRYLENAKAKFNVYIYPVLDTFKKHNIFPHDIKIRKMTTRR
jgi:hypothetical protein